MENEKRPYVISIAAVSGGGKTTIATALSNKLHNSKTLHFDDYDFDGPEDIIDWVNRGANYSEWNLTPFVNDLEIRLAKPLDYIVLDYPFAYKNQEVGRFIDFAVYIDTPLDIAMARRMIRDYKDNDGKTILEDMEFYLSHGRGGYLESLNSVKANSDFVIDGILSIEEIVHLLAKKMGRK